MDSAATRSAQTRPGASAPQGAPSGCWPKARVSRAFGITFGLVFAFSACGGGSESVADSDSSPSLKDMTPQDRVSFVIVERLKAEGPIDEACVYEFNAILSDFSADEFYEALKLEVDEPDESGQALLFASKSTCTTE